jgi:hypothetical protein
MNVHAMKGMAGGLENADKRVRVVEINEIESVRFQVHNSVDRACQQTWPVCFQLTETMNVKINVLMQTFLSAMTRS